MPPALAVVFIAVLVTRLPFTIASGVGPDPDAWRLLLAGQRTVDTGVFQTSRAPTYPLVELVSAGLAGAPWSLFPTLTAVVAAGGAAAFVDLLRTFAVRWWAVPVAGYVLTPVIWRNDVTFMDFSWSLALLLAAFAALARRSFLAAGVLLGLAVAARPATALLVVVPVVVLLLERAPLRAWSHLVLAASTTAAAFFTLPYVSYGGLRFITAFPGPVSWQLAGQRATGDVWGPLGVIAVAALAVLAVWFCGARSRPSRTWCAAALAGLVVMAVAFATAPYEGAYLAPAVALVWLLFGLAVPAPAIGVGVAAVAVSSLMTVGALPWVGSGKTMLQDRAQRLSELDSARADTARVAALPPGTVVVVGYRMPQLLAMQPRSVLAGKPEFADPSRPVNTPQSVPVSGGTILVYGTADIRPADASRPRVDLEP